jgi:hypothetical protein
MKAYFDDEHADLVREYNLGEFLPEGKEGGDH